MKTRTMTEYTLTSIKAMKSLKVVERQKDLQISNPSSAGIGEKWIHEEINSKFICPYHKISKQNIIPFSIRHHIFGAIG